MVGLRDFWWAHLNPFSVVLHPRCKDHDGRGRNFPWHFRSPEAALPEQAPAGQACGAHRGKGMQAVGLRGAWRGRAVVPMAKPPCGVRRVADVLSGTWNKAGVGPHQLGSSPAFPRGSWPLWGRGRRVRNSFHDRGRVGLSSAGREGAHPSPWTRLAGSPWPGFTSPGLQLSVSWRGVGAGGAEAAPGWAPSRAHLWAQG